MNTMAPCATTRPSSSYYAARQSYLAIFRINRRLLSTSAKALNLAHFNRPFTGSYEPKEPTKGPLAAASNHGAPLLTPRKLKEHLDKFVVGQERPKMMMAVAIYNHYQRMHEMHRQEEEQRKREAELVRQRYDGGEQDPEEGGFVPQHLSHTSNTCCQMISAWPCAKWRRVKKRQSTSKIQELTILVG